MQCLEVSGAVRPPVRVVMRQRVESKILHTAHSVYMCVLLTLLLMIISYIQMKH